MHEVVFSPLAKDDLEGICDYIALNLANPSAATEIVAKIIGRARYLSEHPFIGASLDTIIEGDSEGYRFLTCENFTLFYRVEDKHVFIDRILHGSQDFTTILLDGAS